MKSLSLSTPNLIVMVGLPGSGKSFFASKFAQTFNAPLISEEAYAAILGDLESATLDLSGNLARAVLPEILKTGATLIYDGNTGMRAERAEIARIAKQAGYKTLFVWVQTDSATAKQRALRPRRADSKTPLSVEAYTSLIKKFSPPHPSENYIVLSGKHTYSTQAKTLLKKLVEPRAAATVEATPSSSRQQTGNRIKVI